ncbi:UDP-N-acetylmuramoyl-tripeptide--D-alanyl-D-alanine ligase [Patescibacteria group bacterium]|nr:UDP-N-acetylmuramoyl-tripeptide--D-alanyl-D-alanine ligase [Patescibacteria group bacterium]
MKSFLRRILVWKLTLLSRLVLWRRKPNIVAITGSVGKTTTKALTSRMLSERYRVRSSEGNFNTEIGVPLTIIGAKQPKRAGDWWNITVEAIGLLFNGEDYPELLVLELAADKPDDLKHLTSYIHPDIAIVTNVRNVHLEFYDSVERIAEEKSWVVKRLKPGGVAVLNHDDRRTKQMHTLAPDQTLYYGFDEASNVFVTGIKQSAHGQTATLHYRDQTGGKTETYPVKTPLLGRHQLYAIMAAFAAARVGEVDPKQALESIATVQAPPGRLRVLRGKNKLTILDDTYNASPQAVLAALETLYHFKGPHRAILGDMKELGQDSVKGHRDVGEVAGKFLDELVVVGEESNHIAEAAKTAGMKPDKIHFAGNAIEAATLINQDKKGGTVLVKASHTIGLEQSVKALLADPQDAKYLVQPEPDKA